MGLDIKTAVQTAFFLAVIGLLLSFLLGVRAIRAGRKLQFFRKRRDLMVRGWRLIFISVGLAGVALVMNRFAEPAVYRVFPPSPTVTLTSTITTTPTITLTSTITPTATITNTPSVTNTPMMPESVATQFLSSVTPNPDSLFSSVVFSREIKDNLPVEAATEFKSPIDILYGSFSYDKMKSGAQWTALWYRGTDLICYETLPWDGSTGGYGTSKCELPPDQWLPGEYQVQIFVGLEWKSSGDFTVTGKPPTPKPTVSPTKTKSPTATIGPSPTRTPIPSTSTRLPTNTIAPTSTRAPTNTIAPTNTRPPTGTLPPTKTPPPTSTMIPTRTPRITDTRLPTLTKVPPTPFPR
jgi:hypothetical protein